MTSPLENIAPRIKEYTEAVKARGDKDEIEQTAVAVTWMILATQIEHPSPNPVVMLLQRELMMQTLTEQISRLHSSEWIKKHLKPVSELFHRDAADHIARARARYEAKK